MSDFGDALSACVDSGAITAGAPVYTVVKESTEAAMKKWGGVSDTHAKVLGIVTGTVASVTTACLTGMP